MVLASYLGSNIVDQVFGAPDQHSSLEILVAIYAYAVQIWADFSGYTDIAIGVALLLGFQFPQNFDSPYTATSVQDFWRRWHMTLSRWLRDYVYIPLGGSRGGSLKTYRNLLLTFLLGGLWHGAAWRFVIWGAIHGTALSVERMFRERGRANPPAGHRDPALDPPLRHLPGGVPGLGLLPRRHLGHGLGDAGPAVHRMGPGVAARHRSAWWPPSPAASAYSTFPGAWCPG